MARSGDTGAYERISGRVYFSVAVANAHNRAIVDLEYAENLRDGAVEFSADFIAVLPKDPARGNHSQAVTNRSISGMIAICEIR